MVKRRVSILRNKKGHPIYSREDIREQYCITKKEVEVLESAKSIKLFGCLRDPHNSSPCTKNNILFSCINKKRSSQDDNEYGESTEPTGDHQWRSSYDRSAQDEKTKEQEERSAMLEAGQESGDDEYVLSGFRKRPKSFYRTDSKSRLQWIDSEPSEHSGELMVGGMRRRKLESSASLGSTSQQSFDSDREISRNVQRPSQLTFGDRGEPIHYFQPSRSVDELNDTVTTSRRREGPVTTRIAKTPDILLDDRRQKHVSFDNHSLIRSNTVGGGLEDVDSGPAATSTPLSTQRRTFSPPERNRSQERLLDRSLRPLYDYGDYSTATIKSSDISLGSSYRGSLQYRPRRALMKTQATQTELTFKTKHLLPAYLTLSPRAATSQYHRAKTTRHRSSTRLMKSQSAYGALGSEESDEDVMEVDLVGKRHRLLRSSTARASIRRQKAIDSSQEEIMVSFKPAASPPKVSKEVLIGERPLPRPPERERKTGAIPYSKTPDSQDAADKVQAVEIVVKTYRGKAISPRSEPLQITPKAQNSTRSTAKIPDTEQTKSVKETLNSTSHGISSFETEDVPSSDKGKKQEEKPSPEDSSEISGEISPSGRLIRFKAGPETMESSSAKSSSGDSTQQMSRQMWTAQTSFPGPDDASNHSDESPTMTTEDALSSEAVLAQESADKRRKEYLENYQQVNAKSQAIFDNLTSPDSESSSSVFTERETSRSEVSTSSSNKMAKSGSSRSETEENSESSDYITAAEPCSLLAHTMADNSFESASSASLFSSPSSTQHKSSSSVDDSGKEKWKSLHEDTYHDVSEESPFQADDGDLTPTVTSKPMDFGDIKPSSPVSEPLDDYRESSDESTKKESSCSDDEGVIQETAEAEGFSTLETPDSDRTGDLTPVFDASPEPLSSLQEPQTVIEIRSDATSDELLESINGSSPALVSNTEDNGEDDSVQRRLKDVETESESTESSSVYSGQEEAGSSGFIEREERGPIPSYLKKERKASDELSTVSEVSEESSRLEVPRPRRISRRPEYRSSTSEETDTNNGDQRLAKLGGSLELETKSSSSEYIPSETTTPSFDSTTSGSFILENGSYADNESYNGQTEEVTAQCKSIEGEEDVLDEEEDKKDIPETEAEREEEEERPKSEPVRRYSEPGLENLERGQGDKNSKSKERGEVKDEHISKERKDVPPEFKESSSYSTPSDHSEKVLPSSSLSSSSSLTQPSYREEVERHPSLSTWRSEGAIPKQRFQDADTRRRRERARMRSDGGVGSIDQSQQLIPSGRRHSRSKSRSPEKSVDDLESTLAARVLCSQCGEKIRDQTPLSTGMWERQYQRSYWEPPRPPPEPPSPHMDHHHHHQTYLWRQRDRDRLSGVPGPYSDLYGQPTSSRFSQAYGVSQPRSWSESAVPPPEMDLYADDDEDAGIHSESYRNATWIYVSDGDELAVWKQPVEPQEEVQSDTSSTRVLTRSDSLDSTASEHEFLKQYQAVTHRMIHRKSSVEMYKRLANRTFEVDKRVTVQRNNGEFGFRIHGSKPVVVSAIERGTPAETCGLDVGDIIVSINGINVLDASHSEVVRIAHTGTEVLKMEVTRTCHVLAPVLPLGSPAALVYSGFLQRLSVRSVSSRRWCRRWFVIKVDGVLYWYRTCKDHEPLGALVLQNQTISRVPDAGSPHAFKVSKFDGCPHYFSADDEETASRWISALNQVAATASRVDPYLEQCVHDAKLPSTSVPAPDCHGFLAKLSQRWKQWKRRYFLLKDASLYFYTDRNAKVALGIFHLHGYKVQSCSIQGKKHTFEAIPPEPRLKHLYFLADSENEKKRWLAAMEYSIDRWIKVG